MDYKLEKLHAAEFEDLVCMLCHELLGNSTTPFAAGRDGGKDARFEGAAKDFGGWSGKFVIQAKHTSNVSSICSDGDFFENKSSIVNEEIEKIKKMQARNEIDNYLLFTNRQMTGGAEENIRKHIQTETGLKSVWIFGIEYINLCLRKPIHNDIIKEYPKLKGFDMPFEFYDTDIRAVITIFYDTLHKIKDNSPLILDRPTIEQKNEANNLGQSYYENIIKEDLDRYHASIIDFLENPINTEYLSFYEDTSRELKRVITLKRTDFEGFEYIFDYLTKYLLDKEPEKLKKYRNVIPAFFHFMYYQCDIGNKK
jgi:hypothetical protein